MFLVIVMTRMIRMTRKRFGAETLRIEPSCFAGLPGRPICGTITPECEEVPSCPCKLYETIHHHVIEMKTEIAEAQRKVVAVPRKGNRKGR